ncbi:MAG: hypothetical protein ACYTEK_28095, partial [Planctomycetota bacterium]
TGKVIKKTLTSLAEGITGVAAADRKDLALSVGHIFQSLRKGQFLSRFGEEWDSYREKGRIKDDYLETEQHRSCFQELLDFLDNDSPDEIRFEVMKKIFLVAASESTSDRNSLMPYQFLRLCRGMSSGEVIVLNTTYRIAKSEQPQDFSAAGAWLDLIAKESGLAHPALVEIHEERLIEKHLLSRRVHGDRSGVALRPNFRLTSLGLDLCDYIASYDSSSE